MYKRQKQEISAEQRSKEMEQLKQQLAGGPKVTDVADSANKL
ncbi:hypothetical protein JMUB7547_28530 [Staphylococcus aureus]